MSEKKSSWRCCVYVLCHDRYGVVAADYCPVRLRRIVGRMPESLRGPLSVRQVIGNARPYESVAPLCGVCGDDCADGLILGVARKGVAHGRV